MSPAQRRFDAVVYAPWASALLGGSSVGGATGGGETQAVLLANRLAARGLRVALVVMAADDEALAPPDKVHVVRQKPRRRSSGLVGRASLALGALRAMTRLRADVLIQMSAGPTTGVAALSARIRGARLVYMSVHVMDFDFASYEPRGVNVGIYEWGVRHAAEVVVQDTHQAERCRDRFGREPVVIPSVTTAAEPRMGRPDAFLWVGRLQRWKRPDAYLDLARAVPEAKFWMIAVPQENEPPELRRRFEETVRELPNLELLEPRPREELGELMGHAVAIVSTSESEGMPNVFLEGWSRGVPALALSFDPDGMIVRNGLGSWASGDPARLAAEARRLWESRDEQSELAERCIAYVRAEHGEERVIDRWLETIERVRRT